MAGAIIAQARARIAAALPLWTDATGDPHPRAQARLPWFAVALSLSDAERVAMGSAGTIRAGELSVALAVTPADPALAREEMGAHARAVALCLTAAPADLGGLVWSILPGSEDVEPEAGEVRIVRADLSFPLQVIG